jgi:hypothetical protein
MSGIHFDNSMRLLNLGTYLWTSAFLISFNIPLAIWLARNLLVLFT